MLQDQILKDAKGYRSKYINTLNDAVRTNRIVGGDVSPVTTEGGTILLNKSRLAAKRFSLFWGGVPVTDGETTTMEGSQCVGDGCLFIGGRLIKLLNADNTGYKARGILPRGSGWYTTNVGASSWELCEVLIVSFDGAYFMVFRYDDADWSTVITGATEASVEIIAHIGNFTYSTGKIDQFVVSDIYYGGGAVSTERLPWEIFPLTEPLSEDDATLVTTWWIVAPEWTLKAPYSSYPADAQLSTPEKANPIPATIYSREIDGKTCYRVSELKSMASTADIEDGMFVYALLDSDGVPRPLITTSRLAGSPICIQIGYNLVNTATGERTWVQTRKGYFASRWEETVQFYVAEAEDGSIIRTSGEPSLAEGETREKWSFWRMVTDYNGSEIESAEDLNYDPNNPVYPSLQYALFYGVFIWRYRVHWSWSANSGRGALLRDSAATATPNAQTGILANVIDQPFVERVAVVYPETPLDQGHVNSVGGVAQILAIDVQQNTNVSTIFDTEALSTQQGNLIEVTQ